MMAKRACSSTSISLARTAVACIKARCLHASTTLQSRSEAYNHEHSRTTNFGFTEVPEEEKGRLVGDVFKRVASKYDLMNDIMSAGLHRLWKDRLVTKLRPFPSMQHLDVAGGTGDVAFRVLQAIHSREHLGMHGKYVDAEAEDDTRVYICDINPAMLDVGKQKAHEKGLGGAQSLVWVEGDAEALEFKSNSMDGYTIAFGIRNVTHIDKALKEAYRVLRRGGQFLCLELSDVKTPVLKELPWIGFPCSEKTQWQIGYEMCNGQMPNHVANLPKCLVLHRYDLYSFSVIPTIGALVAGDSGSYQYLVESIRKFPSQERFAVMIQQAGFQNVQYENLVGGIVAIHSGFKL